MAEGCPKLDYPLNFLVVKHPKEKIGKSSIMASKVLAPDHVTIHSELEAPEFDFESTILLFPDEEATPITSMPVEELKAVKTAVLIDSTWKQTKRFL